MNAYKIVEQTISDMRSLKIQGATNTAVSALSALRQFSQQIKGDLKKVKIELERVAYALSHARPNEPMTRNAMNFIFREIRQCVTVPDVKDAIDRQIDRFMEIVTDAKSAIVKAGLSVLYDAHTIVSHCHSRTVERILKAIYRKNKSLTVVVTETRPMYQGRITAKALVADGIETIMIVDDAVSGFISDDSFLVVDAVVLGCDEFTVEGDTINKVGSFAIALACHHSNKPLYIATSLLKLGTETLLSKPVIELREGKEIWPDAPRGLKLINPSFELVPHEFITGYITEEGLVEPGDVYHSATGRYPWLRSI